jgi:parallel beta-helix repeat protein
VPDDYATIQAAVDAANPGDKIVVKASGSPYSEAVIVSALKPGVHITAQGPVVLNGYFYVFADNAKIDHFNINRVAPDGYGAIIVEGASNVEISHNTVTGNGTLFNGGIVLNVGSEGCLVKKNTCTNNGFGITVFSSAHKIKDNICTSNGHGIYIALGDNNEVNGNNCSSNDFDGINVNNAADGNKFKGNICNSNRNSGIAISTNSINNNFGPNNKANSNSQYGISLSSGANGNTVKKNDFHCNLLGDIRDLGVGNTFIKNSTGPLPECQ